MASQQFNCVSLLDLGPNKFKSKRGFANMACTRLGVTSQ